MVGIIGSTTINIEGFCQVMEEEILKVSWLTQYLLSVLVFILFFIMFLGCIRTSKPESISTEENSTQYNEYLERFFPAISPFADDDLLLSTLTYIDEIVAKEGNKKINSIYYDKARILYKLDQYDEALDALLQADDTYNAYIATFLMRLGRNEEAIPFLESLIDTNKKWLIEPSIESSKQKRSSVLQGLMMFHILIDKSRDEILSDMADENIGTRNEMEELLRNMLIQDDIIITKENLLESMWPDREVIPWE
jgi:tetratricopeptide (TPR) repeat protein